MIPYKTILLVHPKKYPKNDDWIANRYMFVAHMESVRPDMAAGRGLTKELRWIEKNKPDIALKAISRRMDSMDLAVPIEQEQLQYYEIEGSV